MEESGEDDNDDENSGLTREEEDIIEKGVGFEGFLDWTRSEFECFTEDYVIEREFFDKMVYDGVKEIEYAYSKGKFQDARKIAHSSLKKWKRFYRGEIYKSDQFDQHWGIYAIHLYDSILRHLQEKEKFERSFER